MKSHRHPGAKIKAKIMLGKFEDTTHYRDILLRGIGSVSV